MSNIFKQLSLFLVLRDFSQVAITYYVLGILWYLGFSFCLGLFTFADVISNDPKSLKTAVIDPFYSVRQNSEGFGGTRTDYVWMNSLTRICAFWIVWTSNFGARENAGLSAVRMDAGLIFSQMSRTASVRSLKSKRKVFEFFAFRALVTHIVFLYVFSCVFLFSYLVICFNCIYIFYGIIFFNCFCISKYFRNYPCFRMIIF